MADDQLAGSGRKGQLWISSDGTTGNLFRLKGVKGFDLPKTFRDWLETTDLDSEAKEYAPELPDTEELKATLNYRAGSDTDERLDDVAALEDPVAVRMIAPIRGVLKKQFDFLGYVSYDPGTVESDVMESEVTVRPTGPITRTTL